MRELPLVRSLWPLVRDHRGRAAALVLLGAVAGVCEGLGLSLFLPLLRGIGEGELGADAGGGLGRALDRLFGGVDADARAYWILGAMFGLMAMKATLNAAAGLLFARLDAVLVDDLRRRVLDQALEARLGHVEQRPTGELIAMIQNQTWETSGAVATLLGIVVRAITVVVFGVALLLISWRLTLGVAAALVVISALVRTIGRRADQLSEAGLARWNSLSHRSVELLRGLRTIRSFGAEARERERFAAESEATSDAFWRVERLRALVDPLSELFVAALLAAVLVVSIGEPGRLPTVLTFAFILFRLQPQVQRLDSARVTLAASTAPVRVVTEFCDAGRTPYLQDGDRPFTGVNEAIRFAGATFRYDAAASARPALDRVDASIPARRTTAIVGPSGAGKSTLVHLLLRFADPQEGEVLVDGARLRDLRLAEWRAGIATVAQDAHVFDGSVVDNIRYGRPGASDEEVRAAARRAHADGFIEALPRGYDTVLGEAGLQLSGGQRQRIALARALVRGAGVLVLDEATNALDAMAESVVQDALAELQGERTIIVIAHRFATIERADHVIVLDEGRVAEEGARETLLADEGLFSRLHALQLGGDR